MHQAILLLVLDSLLSKNRKKKNCSQVRGLVHPLGNNIVPRKPGLACKLYCWLLEEIFWILDSIITQTSSTNVPPLTSFFLPKHLKYASSSWRLMWEAPGRRGAGRQASLPLNIKMQAAMKLQERYWLDVREPAWLWSRSRTTPSMAVITMVS